MRTLARFALSISAAAMLAACGGSPPPISAPDAKSAARPLASRSYQVIYSFQASNDAELPLSEDAPLLDSGGLLYGTAAGGNTGKGCGVSCGTAFGVSQSD